MTIAYRALNRCLVLSGVFATILVAAWVAPVRADDSDDIQAKISQSSSEANDYEAQALQAESNGDNATACTAYRNAAIAWREAARAGTSLITESLRDKSIDPDIAEKNVDIMVNNSSIDDQHADAVCN
ncbi:MAG: hypothetical protein ABL973_20540 [Micropepsaceae bacterium]